MHLVIRKCLIYAISNWIRRVMFKINVKKKVLVLAETIEKNSLQGLGYPQL